ncbi:MAG: hypothetical protein HY529_03500 [Chloroflexi bacterium]|nr:hypothetical protein [Chloroflexota bacterium]
MKRLVLILRRRWPQVTLLLALLLLASCLPESCGREDWASYLKKNIGLDVNNPGELTQKALAGDIVGNKEQADAMTAVEGFHREEFTAKGDEAFNQGYFKSARRYYGNAMEWTGRGNTARIIKSEKLDEKMALSFAGEASYDFRNRVGDNGARGFGAAASWMDYARDSAMSRLDTNAANYYAALGNSYREKAKLARQLQ